MIIGLIGLGEMGSEIGRYLVMNDLEVISVYEERSEISKKRASKYRQKRKYKSRIFRKDTSRFWCKWKY